MRHQILQQLHASHQGTVGPKEPARLVAYWSGLDNDIKIVILSCKQCQDNLPFNQKEPIIFKSKPARPFQEVAVDFCSYAGQKYLVAPHRLARHHTYGKQYHSLAAHKGTQSSRLLLPNKSTRQVVVRLQFTSKILHNFLH